jgi:hypothetical protein
MPGLDELGPVLAVALFRVSAIEDAGNEQPDDPQRQANEDKRQNGANDRSQRDTPNSLFLHVNNGLSSKKVQRTRPVKQNFIELG